MTSQPIAVLELRGNDPLKMGHQHGETYREKIGEVAEIRLERICAMSPFPKVKDVLALAYEHVPLLERFDADLYAEFRGIAESAKISFDRLVVLNHYTDLRDIIPSTQKQSSGQEDNGGCSIIYSPHRPVLGQTWDIHGSAEPYVLLIKINDVMVFSMTGCLGMTGLNSHGVGIAINNLVSNDAKIGVVWPALIRKGLKAKSAIAAKDEIMAAPIGSGRHFAVADKRNFFSIETSGTKKKLLSDNRDELFFHTNHCLDEEMRKTHIILKDSTTVWRYQQLDEVTRFEDLSTAEQVFLALARVSLPADANEPHKITTCGTFVMDLASDYALACQGIPNKDLLTCAQIKQSIR